MENPTIGASAIAARMPAIAVNFDETSVQLLTPGNVEELATCTLALYKNRLRLDDLAHNIQ